MTKVWTFEKLCEQKKLLKLLGATAYPKDIVVNNYILAGISVWYTVRGYASWEAFDVHMWIQAVLKYSKL